MRSEDIRRHQNELNALVRELSNATIGEEDCEVYLNRFAQIYRDGFHHQYSAFHPVLQQIMASSAADYEVSEFLTANLNMISKYIADREYSDVSADNRIHQPINASIYKLCDHINLELTRINEQRNQESRLQELYVKIGDAQTKLERAKTDAEKARKKVNRAQTDILAILSVFAAVILAFMGGMTFLSGAMSSISETRVYKFVIACCICGFIIFNTIFLLLYIVSKIIEKPIYARCKSLDCTCDPRCCALNRVRKRLPYVFYFNVCILALLLSVVFVQYGVPAVKVWPDDHEESSMSETEAISDNDAGENKASAPEQMPAIQE